MSMDVWSSPTARAAATTVFALANEQPLLRPASSTAAVRIAAALPIDTERVPKAVVEELIAGISEGEARRFAGLADQLAPPAWRALVSAVGAEHAREPLLAGVATAALSELLPPPRWLVVMREATVERAPGPLNVLASLLHPESVWSKEEAGAAQALAGPRAPERAVEAVFSFARTELARWRLERVRLIAAPLARLLPLAGAPRTSDHLLKAIELVRRSRRGPEELCCLLLLTYAMRLDGLVPIVPPQN
jgi:hypothetical protein